MGNPDSYFYTRDDVPTLDLINKLIIENSDDWEELKPVLFTTDDGIEITDPQQLIYLISKKQFRTRVVNAKHLLMNSNYADTYLVFSTEEARKEAIPILSIRDVNRIFDIAAAAAGKKTIMQEQVGKVLLN